MNLLEKYIKQNFENRENWFIEEVHNSINQKRVMEVVQMKKYLSGQHAILDRQVENYNGKPYEQRSVVLQYAKLIANLEATYLLKNPLTITGDEEVVKDFKRIYKRGKFDKIDFQLLLNLVKFGNAYEYLYVDENNNIKSKVIHNECAYPVYNDDAVMVGFVEYYTNLETEYYIVYDEQKVTKYGFVNNQFAEVESFNNVTGLPVHYKTDNDLDYVYGRSDIYDWVNIIDSMEDLISKFTDSFYKHHNPIPVVVGQRLTGEGMDKHVVGSGIQLDDGADFKMVSNELNQQAFEVIYKTLKQELINIASVPSVSLNATDVSNLSETSMKMLYQLADMKGGINEKYMRDGLEDRNEKILNVLSRMGKAYDEEERDSVGIVFHVSRPVNETDVIDNLVKLYEMGVVSKQSVMDIAPYISDTNREIERLKNESEFSNDGESDL